MEKDTELLREFFANFSRFLGAKANGAGASFDGGAAEVIAKSLEHGRSCLNTLRVRES